MGRKTTRTEEDVRRYQWEYKREMRKAQGVGLKYSAAPEAEATRQARNAELWRLIAKHGGLSTLTLSQMTGQNYQSTYVNLVRMAGVRKERVFGRKFIWVAEHVSAAWKEVL
jgi:hypothetical protein